MSGQETIHAHDGVPCLENHWTNIINPMSALNNNDQTLTQIAYGINVVVLNYSTDIPAIIPENTLYLYIDVTKTPNELTYCCAKTSTGEIATKILEDADYSATKNKLLSNESLSSEDIRSIVKAAAKNGNIPIYELDGIDQAIYLSALTEFVMGLGTIYFFAPLLSFLFKSPATLPSRLRRNTDLNFSLFNLCMAIIPMSVTAIGSTYCHKKINEVTKAREALDSGRLIKIKDEIKAIDDFTQITKVEASSPTALQYSLLLGDAIGHAAEIIGLCMEVINLITDSPTQRAIWYSVFTAIAIIASISDFMTCYNTLVSYNDMLQGKRLPKSTTETKVTPQLCSIEICSIETLFNIINSVGLRKFTVAAKAPAVLLANTLDFSEIFNSFFKFSPNNIPLGVFIPFDTYFIALMPAAVISVFITIGVLQCQYRKNMQNKDAGCGHDHEKQKVTPHAAQIAWEKLTPNQKLYAIFGRVGASNEFTEPLALTINLLCELPPGVGAAINIFLLCAGYKMRRGDFNTDVGNFGKHNDELTQSQSNQATIETELEQGQRTRSARIDYRDFFCCCGGGADDNYIPLESQHDSKPNSRQNSRTSKHSIHELNNVVATQEITTTVNLV